MSDFFKQLGSVLDEGVSALGEGFATLGNSSKEVLAASKLRTEIASLQEQKDALIRKIGGMAYAAHQEGADTNDALTELYARIDELDGKLAELKAKQEEHWRTASKPFTCECKPGDKEPCECEDTCCCEETCPEGEEPCGETCCEDEACDCQGATRGEPKEEINVTDILEKAARAFAEGVVTVGQKVGSVATSTFAAVQAGAERGGLENARRQALNWMGERVLELYHQGIELDPALACKCAEVAEIDRQVGEKKDAVNQHWNAARAQFTGAEPATAPADAPCDSACEAEPCQCQSEPCACEAETPAATVEEVPPQEVIWEQPAPTEVPGEENKNS